jgi:succinate-semialdehyde dehydrogenase/glutarate-semialdehyde dehydrogenase
VGLLIYQAKIMGCQTIKPCGGNLPKSFEEMAADQLEAALKTAGSCFETWRKRTFAERATVVAKAAAFREAKGWPAE